MFESTRLRLCGILLVSISIIGIVGCSPLLKKGVIAGRTQNQFSRVGSPGEFHSLGLSFQLTSLDSRIRVGQEASFRLVFWREGEGSVNGPYSDPGLFPHVWLWMRMPAGDDHGSFPVEVTPSRDSQGVIVPGSYEVTQVVFNMGREWEIHIELKRADGTVVDAAVQTIWI